MIKLTKIAVIFVFILTTSCKKKIAKPDNLIAEDKMVRVLTDLALLNAGESVNKKLLQSYNIISDQYIYKKYNIDSLQFATSNNYYAHDVDSYKRIYTKVKASLTAKKVAYKKIEDEEKAKRKIEDSIRRAKRIKNSKKLDTDKLKTPQELKTKTKK